MRGPDVDTDALEDAAWAKCHESIHPAPGADPCAGWQGALVIVRGSGAADARHDPAAQPLQDGGVKISLGRREPSTSSKCSAPAWIGSAAP